MRFVEGLLSAGIGMFGVVVGSYIAGTSAKEVAEYQVSAQRQAIKSEAALKIFEFRSKAMADVLSAKSKFETVGLDSRKDAAQELAVAAAAGATRLDGRAKEICLRVQYLASSFASVPEEDIRMRADYAGRISRGVTELMYIYSDLQDAALSSAFGGDYVEPKSNLDRSQIPY